MTVKTFRHFRGSLVQQDKNNQIIAGMNTTGGISFLFEINYDTTPLALTYTASITLDEDNFDAKNGRENCMYRAARSKLAAAFPNSEVARIDSAYNSYTIQYDPQLSLVENVYEALCNDPELQKNKFQQTLQRTMKKYALQNAETEKLVQQLIADGIVEAA